VLPGARQFAFSEAARFFSLVADQKQILARRNTVRGNVHERETELSGLGFTVLNGYAFGVRFQTLKNCPH
jgi:hypothetical protein